MTVNRSISLALMVTSSLGGGRIGATLTMSPLGADLERGRRLTTEWDFCGAQLDAGDTRAALPIAAYKKLYEIEAKIHGPAPDDKLAERQAESKPVFDEIVSWAEAYKPQEPPASGLGAAIRWRLRDVPAMLPAAWKAARQAAVPAPDPAAAPVS